MMNILAVGAHPDDVEMYCAGTLAKYAKAGHKVFIATATNGNVGSATHSMEEIAKIRKKEAAKSAALIGAEYICLDYDDEMFFESAEVRLKFIDLVRYCRADVILTHNAQDYNPDHELTSKVIRDLAVMPPIAHLKTQSAPFDKIPLIYYFEPVSGLGFTPQDYVDISDVIEVKKQMLACHESQVAWMSDNYKDDADAGDLVNRMMLTAMYRGMQCGVKYAEGFVRTNDAFRVPTKRILP